MKLFAIVLIMVFIPRSIFSQEMEWKVFQSEEGAFSILSPGFMESKKAIVESEIGETVVHTLYYNQKDTTGNFLYLINFYDLPENSMPADSTDLIMDFLANTMDQAVSDIDGSIQYNNPIEIGPHKGLMWRSKSEKQVVKSRAYVINNTFYMLQVFSIPNKSLNGDVDRFLESFTLKSS